MIQGKLIGSIPKETTVKAKDYIYELTEITPANGYTVHAPIYLKMDLNGVLYQSNEQTGTYSPVTTVDADNNSVLKVADTQNKVSLKKTQADGKTLLSGSAFSIKPATGSAFATTVNGSTTDARTIASDGTAFEGQLIAGGKYIISETTAPAGYLKVADFEISVDTSGALSFVNTDDHAQVTLSDGTFIVADTQNSVTLNKVDESGAPSFGCDVCGGWHVR